MLSETLALYGAVLVGLLGLTWAAVGVVRQVHPGVNSYGGLQLIQHFAITSALLVGSYLLFGVAF